MACFHPLLGYRSRVAGASGKHSVVFNVADGYIDLPVVVPCGQCSGCRLKRSRDWAVRCMHEASLYLVPCGCCKPARVHGNCFVTLTYSDEFVPRGGSLVKKDFQDFLKRLRRRFPHDKIRYFHCGEYGEKYGRPHYHACLFGFDFPDKYQWSVRKGFPVWRSSVLEGLWPYGNSELGSVTFESAAYVARYIMKKVTGETAKDHYAVVVEVDEETGECETVDRVPEYVTMSRGGNVKGPGNLGGIGKRWFQKFQADVFPSDEVIVDGYPVQPPKYYDGLYELVDGPGALEVARARRRGRRLEDETPERLAVREACTLARLANLKREVE